MKNGFSVGRDETSGGVEGKALPPFVPSIDMHQVFRQLIVDELRGGKAGKAGLLTDGQRRRIVRYAAGLGLSAVQAGRLIASCRDEAGKPAAPELASRRTSGRIHALHIVEPAPTRIPTVWKIAMVVTCALVADYVILILLC